MTSSVFAFASFMSRWIGKVDWQQECIPTGDTNHQNCLIFAYKKAKPWLARTCYLNLVLNKTCNDKTNVIKAKIVVQQNTYRDDSLGWLTLPWVPEVFLACGGNFQCWPKADTSSAVGRSHESPLTFELFYGIIFWRQSDWKSLQLWSCGPAREEMSKDSHYP